MTPVRFSTSASSSTSFPRQDDNNNHHVDGDGRPTIPRDAGRPSTPTAESTTPAPSPSQLQAPSNHRGEHESFLRGRLGLFGNHQHQQYEDTPNNRHIINNGGPSSRDPRRRCKRVASLLQYALDLLEDESLAVAAAAHSKQGSGTTTTATATAITTNMALLSLPPQQIRRANE